MVMPDGKHQMSLALMSRGEELIYVVVGEYVKVEDDASLTGFAGIPSLQNGTSYDFANDPAAGRGDILLHRAGTWSGQLATLDEDLNEGEATDYQEQVQVAGDKLLVNIGGTAFDDKARSMTLATNNWQAWSAQDSEIAGSYSLSGGRALSGNFHHLATSLRVWRREVVSHDGTMKAVLHTWFRGAVRVGVQFGILQLQPT
jgi:hypothetical protein